MCCGCWEKFGSPRIFNHRIRSAIRLVDRVYEFHGSGGGLHIVLDDWNLEDASILFCENYIEQPEYQLNHNDEVSEERLKAERACIQMMKAMTEEERASALAIYDGCFKPS